MTTSNVVLILGAGARVGAAVAKSFAEAGYKVAVASRRGTGALTPEGYLSLQADLSNPASVPPLFDAVKTEFKTFPSTVVYNAAAMSKPAEDGAPLSVPAASLASDLNTNSISPYVAAQVALKEWKTLPKDSEKTFIYTGNQAIDVIAPVPMMMTLSVGKRASSAWIGHADLAHSKEGYR